MKEKNIETFLQHFNTEELSYIFKSYMSQNSLFKAAKDKIFQIVQYKLDKIQTSNLNELFLEIEVSFEKFTTNFIKKF